jgi:hypothetical protein
MALLKIIAAAPRGGPFLRRCRIGAFALALLATIMPAGAAESAPPPEYQLKAVFLYNFAQFVEWPARAFPTPDSPLVIGVLGENPFGAYLDDLVKGEKVGDRPLLVRRFKRVEDVNECHILFVCASEAPRLESILAGLKGRSVLTVSDLATFSRQGGIVRFVTDEGKIGLRISVVAAKGAGLTISSKILRPDMIVAPGKD